MDRDRLKQVHTTDITESRINEEFLEWLKTKFWTWVLFALVIVAAWMGLIRWRQARERNLNEAWAALSQASMPMAFEDVAAKYEDVPGLSQEARRLAAGLLLRAVQTGRSLEGDPANPVEITPELRQDYLARADRLYREILQTDDGSDGMVLQAACALSGHAVIAECRGDVDEARTLFNQAAARAESIYPEMAARMRRRAEAVPTAVTEVTLPSQNDLPKILPREPDLTPATLEDSLRSILLRPFGAG